jgi:hypothetical protein
LAQRPGFAPTRNNYTPAPPGRHFDPRYLITVADAPVPSGKSGQPQYRQAPHARIPFGVCLGLASPLLIPRGLGCGIQLGNCVSTLLGNPEGPAGCVLAAPYCLSAGAIGLGCYGLSRGLPIPDLPQDLQ